MFRSLANSGVHSLTAFETTLSLAILLFLILISYLKEGIFLSSNTSNYDVKEDSNMRKKLTYSILETFHGLGVSGLIGWLLT